jgi:hypothetical protein
MVVTPERAIVGLGIFLALWYLGASIFNRRRGLAVFYWLRDDLEQFGGEIASRWLGSSGSGARIQIHKADPPYRDLEIAYLLASRELLPLFLVDLLRDKRDQLIFKARLRSSYPGEVEVVPAAGSLARQMKGESDRPWDIDDGPSGLLIGMRRQGGEKLRDALTPLLNKYGAHVRHISWSQKAPHLIVVLSLAGLFEKGGSAAGLYDDLTALVTRVLE